MEKLKNAIKLWIRRAIKHTYFPEIWYATENWLFTIDNSGKKVLEIGSGKGLFSYAFVKTGREIISIDPSTQSLAYAQKRVEEQSDAKIAFYQQNPEQIEFEDDFFDSVTCINILEFSLNPQKAIAEAYRVLKPNGKAIIVVFRSFTPWAISNIGSALRKDTSPKPFKCYTKKELENLIATTPFQVDSIKLRGRYLPIMPGNSSIPWPVNGAIVARVQKNS